MRYRDCRPESRKEARTSGITPRPPSPDVNPGSSSTDPLPPVSIDPYSITIGGESLMAATATSLQQSATPSAMGRPLPTPLNTPLNGTSSAKSSSPSVVPKPPASGSLTSSSPILAVNGAPNTSTSRSNRNRTRPSQTRTQTKANGNDGQRGLKRKHPEPHVRTTDYILRKFRNKPPSLIIHLHPTHFRLDQQDGTWSYNSPMRVLIQHLKEETVPHDILEELMKQNVAFYDGCLIVEIHDHKTSPTTTRIASSELGDHSSWEPFSIHNYNNYITPSPFAPFRSKTDHIVTPSDARNETLKDEHDGSMAPPDVSLKRQGKNGMKKPKVFTTVLHPTPLSRHREISILATTLVPDTRSNNRRQSTQSSRDVGTPLSAGPPTPLGSTPSTPGASRGSSKRQKVMLEEHQIHDFEADILRRTEPPLYLEPALNFDHAREIMKDLTDPLHTHAPMRSKGRKRTTAELAADEAQAVEEERFALIMDERLEPSLSLRNGLGTTMADSRDKAKDFQPDFSRFKALEDIKRNHEEEARQKEVQKNQDAQNAASKARREQMIAAEQAKRRDMEERNRQQLLAAQAQQAQAQRNQQRQQQLEQRQIQRINAAGQMHHQMMPNMQQNLIQQASQPQQASPIVNNHLPVHSSPLASAGFPSNGQHTAALSSGPNASSPPRPTSAMQVQPQMTHPMARQASQQTSQPALSRNSTPQIANATPQPVTRNMTPHHQLAHTNVMTNGIQGTPGMGQAAMHTPQVNHGSGLTPEQQARLRLGQTPMAGNTHQVNGHVQNSVASNQFMSQMSPQQRQVPQAQQIARQQSTQGPAVTQGQVQNVNQQQAMTPQQLEYKKTITAHHRQGQQNTSMQQPGHTSQQIRPPSSAAGSPPDGAAMAHTMSRNPSHFAQQSQNMPGPHPQMAMHQNNGMQQLNQSHGTPMQNQTEQLQLANQMKMRHQQQQQQQQQQQIQALRQNFMKSLVESHGGQLPPDAEQKFMNFFRQRQNQAAQMRLQQQAQQFQHPGQQQMMMPGQGLQQGNLQNLQNLHNLQMQNQTMQQNPNNAALLMQHQKEAAARAQAYQAQMMQQRNMVANGQGQGHGMPNNLMQGRHPMMNGMNGGMNGMNGMPHGPPGGGMG